MLVTYAMLLSNDFGAKISVTISSSPPPSQVFWRFWHVRVFSSQIAPPSFASVNCVGNSQSRDFFFLLNPLRLSLLNRSDCSYIKEECGSAGHNSLGVLCGVARYVCACLCMLLHLIHAGER